jgi:hypothetical protein
MIAVTMPGSVLSLRTLRVMPAGHGTIEPAFERPPTVSAPPGDSNARARSRSRRTAIWRNIAAQTTSLLRTRAMRCVAAELESIADSRVLALCCRMYT